MNKFIVVTGGSKGIGKEIIKKFASQGFDAITCARNEADLQQFQEFIAEEYQQKLYYQIADLSKKEDVLTFATFVKSIQENVDVLVNNTGVFLPGLLVEEPEGNLEFMIETNLYSAYHLSRALAPGMIARKKGYIFNMCSIASILAYPNGGSYAISKFALYGMTKVMREEMKNYGVRVTAVLPGATLTPSWDGVDIPADRFIKPEDIAETIFSAYNISSHSVIEELIIRPQLGDL